MKMQCGSDLYKGEICYFNVIDKKIYPSVLSITEEELGKLEIFFKAMCNFKEGDFVDEKKKILYKLL